MKKMFLAVAVVIAMAFMVSSVSAAEWTHYNLKIATPVVDVTNTDGALKDKDQYTMAARVRGADLFAGVGAELIAEKGLTSNIRNTVLKPSVFYDVKDKVQIAAHAIVDSGNIGGLGNAVFLELTLGKGR